MIETLSSLPQPLQTVINQYCSDYMHAGYNLLDIQHIDCESYSYIDVYLELLNSFTIIRYTQYQGGYSTLTTSTVTKEQINHLLNITALQSIP